MPVVPDLIDYSLLFFRFHILASVYIYIGRTLRFISGLLYNIHISHFLRWLHRTNWSAHRTTIVLCINSIIVSFSILCLFITTWSYPLFPPPFDGNSTLQNKLKQQIAWKKHLFLRFHVCFLIDLLENQNCLHNVCKTVSISFFYLWFRHIFDKWNSFLFKCFHHQMYFATSIFF